MVRGMCLVKLMGLLLLRSSSVFADPSAPRYTPPIESSGLSVDAMEGNDRDLIPWQQSDRIGKDCFGGPCKPKPPYIYYNDGCNCDRDCSRYPEPRVCYWKFFAEQYTAMGPACQNCSTGNTSHCFQHQCVVGDGREKTVFVINRMTPGPTISVCRNDLIIVDVTNLMTSASLTIHWHGMLQQNTSFMDGAPYVSQCPIPPNGQFRYKFPALTEGTLWYHAHLGNIQRDGLLGGLIVRVPRREEPRFLDYDYDLNCHIININDWQQFLFDYEFPGYNKNTSHTPIKAEGYTINGFGSFNDNKTITNTPHCQFRVNCGYKYRMRIISSSSISCLYEFAIEDHYLEVIALDGNTIKPVTVKSIVSGPGMRTDFMVNANRCNRYGRQGTGKCSFYMSVRALDRCTTFTLPQTAFLVYDCCNPIPTNTLNYTSIYDGPSFDYVEKGCNRSDVICSHECEAAERPPDPRLAYDGKCEYRVFWNANGYLFTFDDLFNNSLTPYQPFYLPVGRERTFTDTLNNITSLIPPSRLLDRFPIPENMFCHNDCKENFCACINLLRFPYNACVEFVFDDELGANHPFHLHGHQWYVLKMGSPEEKARPNYWKNINRNKYPPRRDVTITPSRGYTVVRWIANNPDHLAMGMFALLQVGQRDQFQKAPDDFPRCEPYLPAAYEVSDYSRKCTSKYSDSYRYSTLSHSGSEMNPSPKGSRKSMDDLEAT